MSRKVRSLSLLMGIVGAGIFAWVIGKVGLATIFENAQLLGLGLAVLILLGGARQILRTIAWRRCLGPGNRTPSFLELFRLRVIGEALDDLLPAGPLIGEPIKAWAAGKQMPLEASVSSVIIENLLFILTGCAFVLSGAVLLLVQFANPSEAGWLIGSLCAGLVVFGLSLEPIVRRSISLAVRFLNYLRRRGPLTRLLVRHERTIASLERTVSGFVAAHKKTLFYTFVIEFGAIFTGVLDAYVILHATAAHASITGAYVIGSVMRALQGGLAFLPGGLGALEGAAGAIFKILGYAASEGVSLIIYRRIRTFVWAALGLLLAPRHAAISIGKAGTLNETAHC